jgi:hypothetical protein
MVFLTAGTQKKACTSCCPLLLLLLQVLVPVLQGGV